LRENACRGGLKEGTSGSIRRSGSAGDLKKGGTSFARRAHTSGGGRKENTRRGQGGGGVCLGARRGMFEDREESCGNERQEEDCAHPRERYPGGGDFQNLIKEDVNTYPGTIDWYTSEKNLGVLERTRRKADVFPTKRPQISTRHVHHDCDHGLKNLGGNLVKYPEKLGASRLS